MRLAWIGVVIGGLAAGEVRVFAAPPATAPASSGASTKPAVAAATSAPAPAAAASARPPSPAPAVRRDPAGKRGISPFWEAVHQGDNAFIARDFDGAIAAYRDAITKDPQNALGHYRMTEAQIAKGNLEEAEAAVAAGLRFAVSDPVLRAKLAFLAADLAERRKAYDEALTRWSEYETMTGENKDAKGHPETAAERKRVITAWKAALASATEVKARIDKRLKEADESMRKSSK